VPTPLLAGEHKQLSVDGEQLGDGVLEATAGLDSGADRVDPLSGNGFYVLLAVDHESECVKRMSGSLGAMAAWFSAPPMGQHQGTGESVGRNAEALQEPPFAAFQGGSLGPHRRVRSAHLIVILQSELQQNKPNLKCFIEPDEVRPKLKAELYFERTASEAKNGGIVQAKGHPGGTPILRRSGIRRQHL